MLKDYYWIPAQAKDHAQHEPRDGLVMCPNHHRYFDNYQFFIHFFPDVGFQFAFSLDQLVLTVGNKASLPTTSTGVEHLVVAR